MAKLNKEAQENVKKASSQFLPMPECVLHARLRDVDPTRDGPKGPYWAWEFEIVEDETFMVEDDTGKPVEVKSLNRRLWNNTSLTPEAAFSFERTFRAFGVDSDTDTDELLGDIVKLVIGVRTIQEGDRKGELVNQINNLKPADPEWAAKAGKAKSDRTHIDEIFSSS